MEILLLTTVSGLVFQRSLGAYQLAHNCRQHGFSCQVIDFIQDFSEQELYDTAKQFVSIDTLCLGISTSFFNEFKMMVDNKSVLPLSIPENVSNVCIKLKKEFPKLRICLGGAKALHGVDYDWVDDIFQGYSEDQFLKYCGTLKKGKTDKFIKTISGKRIYDKQNSSFDIQTLNHKFLPEDCILEKEVLPIEISRGCIFKCKFCAFPLNGKRKLDYLRDIEQIKEELEYNYRHFGTTKYFFNDDTLNDSVFKIEELHKVITALSFKIEFSCWMRLDLLYKNPETITMLKEMGLSTVFFGIESFRQDTLKIIGKSLKPEIVKQFLLDLYNVHWNKDVSIFLGMIVGLPHETEEDIFNSVSWLKDTPFSFHFEPLRLKDSGGTYYQSDFEKNYNKYGYTINNNTWCNDVMTQHTAEKIASIINTEYAYGKNKPSGSYLFAILNHFELDEIKDLTIKDISYKKLYSTRKKLISKYKEKIKRL
jgi:radical SAM superfamily enzyme YgiQ (UPF0313 family)